MAGGGNLPPGNGGPAAAPGVPARRMSAAESDSLLPKYDPQSTLPKREANRSRSAEKAIHLIPIFLLACAMILWFFSSPPRVSLVSDAGAVLAPPEGGRSKAEQPPSVGLPEAKETLLRSSAAAVDEGGGD